MLIFSEKKVKRLKTDNTDNFVYFCGFRGPEAATVPGGNPSASIMDKTQLPFLWEVLLTVVEPICIVILIIAIRKTRVSKWERRRIRLEEAANKESERPKVGFQQAVGTGEEKEVKKLPKWPDVIRKWLRIFPPRKLNKTLTVGGFKSAYFFDYCPDKEERKPRDERNRDLILGFKGGKHEVPVYLVTEYIFRHIPERDRENWVFCVIPASTREKNEKRNRDFCEQVSHQTGIRNGYKDIFILYDRTDSRHQKEDDTVWNLQFGNGVENKHVLLFDDIITRGVSFTQCAEKIKGKGAASVTGPFLGRTLR